MAERGGRRVSFFSPAKVSIDSRGRLTMCAPGSSFSTIGRMVAAPSTSVSSRARRLSMRSVKTWPRSRSAPSWTSSMARNATSMSRGMASTVETQKRGLAGLIFSSPVISATLSTPARSTTLL